MTTSSDYERDLKAGYQATRKRLFNPVKPASSSGASPANASAVTAQPVGEVVEDAPVRKPKPEARTMHHSLGDLNEHLFSQLDRLTRDDITNDQLETEVRRSAAVVAVASQIIGNADTAIKAAKLTVDHGDRFQNMVPMVEGRKKAE